MIRFFKDRAAKNAASLGHLEIAVMELVWARGESNVRDVMERIERPLAYTTVMTTLDRLYKKGMLERRKGERAFFYTPRFSRQEWEQKRAGDLLAGLFADQPHSGPMLISCLVEAVGDQDAALLDELERKIRLKRKELRRNA